MFLLTQVRVVQFFSRVLVLLRRLYRSDVSSTANSGKLVHVPEEITSEILRRLPVKSLLRFRCVCKSWRDLILSAQFVQSQRCPRVIFFTDSGPALRVKEKEEDDDVDKLRKMKLCESMHLGEDYQIHGHCNGIICLSLVDGYLGNNDPDDDDLPDILLWNPALRQCRALPPSPVIFYNLYRFSFGYDSSNCDYKVVNVPSRTAGTSEMYSLKNNSWKQIHCDHLRFLEYEFSDISDRGCFFKGRLHWIADCRHLGGSVKMFLVVFDLTGEKFLEFDIPESLYEHHGYELGCDLGVFKGRLSWLMINSGKEYEIWSSGGDSCTPESWTRVCKISREAFQLSGLRVSLIELTEDENVFIEFNYRYGDRFVFSYDVQRNGLRVRKTVLDDGFLWRPLTNYVETLVSIMLKTATATTSSGNQNCSEDE